MGHGVRHIDRDLKLLAGANLLFALGVGLYLQLLYVYALKHLGASGFAVGVLNAVYLATMAAGNIPGAWAAARFRLKPVIVAVWWLTVPAALSFYLAPSWPWLIPGLLISGLYMANNPAFKAYIYLKSEPERVARNMTFVLASYPLGLIAAPLIGGYLASRFGMRTVFLVSAGMYVLSSSAVSFIRDTPYHTADAPWSFTTVRRNRSFRRYLLFFLVGYLAVSVGSPFLNPFLSQVHHQGYRALGIYSSLAALGAAVLTPAMGRVSDLYGPRAGIGGVLVFLFAGATLLVVGRNPALWATAMLCCGAFDTSRFVATGIVGHSFGTMPTAWGFAIFDAIMGIPMAGGAVLGGLLYRQGYRLPFVFVMVLAMLLVIVLLAARGSFAQRPATDVPATD